jgi:PHD/YefM family antitoxin component YafN of YafNO toxin-antitoxin module
MADAIESERRDASAARVPSVAPGRAIVYTRYGEEKAVVMNPQDFRRLAELDEALSSIVLAAPEMSELARRAHALEDTPGTAIEDAAAIKALLGL